MTKRRNSCMCPPEPEEISTGPVNNDGVVAPARCFVSRLVKGIAERSRRLQGDRRALWLSEEQEEVSAMDIIRQLEAEQAAKIEAKRKLPEFQPGDTVRVQVRVTEGTRTRVQAYEGVVIARSGAGFQENFTVRKISYGEGVERVFPDLLPQHRPHRMLRAARCVAQSFIICAIVAASRPVFRKTPACAPAS